MVIVSSMKMAQEFREDAGRTCFRNGFDGGSFRSNKDSLQITQFRLFTGVMVLLLPAMETRSSSSRLILQKGM